MNYTLAKIFASECIQLICCINVLSEMRGLKLGIGGLAHVVLRKLTVGTHRTAQQSSAEGSVSERGDAALAGVWQNITFHFALEKIVGRLPRTESELFLLAQR